MAAQDKWIISLDLDTSGLTRGLSDIRGQLDALGRPAGFTGGSSSTYLSGGEQVVGAIGPGYAGGAGVGGDTGGLRELMAAQVAMASNIQQQVSQIRNLSNLNRNAIGRGTGDIITLPGSAARERAVVDIAAARTQSGLARQYTNQLRSTVGYQAQIITSQQDIIAANRYAAASIRRRADVAYNQVLAIAQPAQTPLPVAPSSPTAVAPRALPLPVSQTGDRNIPLVVAAPPARAIQTARETARTSINQPYSDNTNRLLAAEGGLIAALSSKAQALQAQTSIVTSNLGRFAAAENGLIAAMEAKAAALAQVPSTALPVGATASAITSGAIPPAVAAGVIPRGALGPATVTQTIAPRPQYERVRPQYIDSPTQGRVFQTAIDAEKMWDRFVESARSFQPKFAEQLGPAFTRDIAGARATAITRGDYSELLTRISRLIPPSNFSPIEPVAGDRLRYASAKALEYHPFLLDRFKEIGSFTQIGVNRPLTARGLTRQSNQPTYVGYNDNFGTGAYTDEIFAKKYKAGLEASPVITKTAFHEVAGHHLDYAALDRSKDRYAATLSRVLQRYVGPVDNPEDVIRDALGPYAATRNQAGRLSEVIPEAVAQVYTAPKPSGLALDLYQGVHQLVAPAPSLQEIERRRRSIAAGDQSFTRDIAGARYQNRSRDREYLGSGVDAEAFGFTGPFGQQLVERIFDDALPTRLIERRVEGLRRAADVPRAEQLVSAQGRDVITTRLPGKDLWNPLGVNPTLPQIAELVDTLKQLGSRGVSIDAGAGNFLYEPQRGFGVIDFQPTNINTGIATRQNVESGLNTVRNALPRNPQVPVAEIYELEAAALRDIAGARYNQRRDIREFDLDATGNFPVLQRMLPYQGGYLEAQVLALPHGSDIPYQLAGQRPELRPSVLPVGTRVLDNQPLLTNSQISTNTSYNDGNELPYIGRRDWDEVVRYIQNDKIPQSRRDFPKATDLVSRLREQTRLDFDSNGLDAARLYRGTHVEAIGPSAQTGNKWVPDVSSSWTSGAFRDDLATTFAGWRASSAQDLGSRLDFPVLLTANVPKESIVSYDRYGNQASSTFEKVGGGLTEKQVAQLRANTGNVAAVNGLLGQFGTIPSPTFAIPGREVLVDATGGAGFQLPADFRDELQGFVNAARVWRNQLENVGAAALLRPPVQGTGKLIVPPVPTTPAQIAAFWGNTPDIAGARVNARPSLVGADTDWIEDFIIRQSYRGDVESGRPPSRLVKSYMDQTGERPPRRGLGRQEYLDEFVSLTRRVQDNEKFGDLRDPASYPGLPGATSADAERLWRHANTSETFPGQPSWVDFSKARGYTEPQIADMRRLRTLFGDDEIIGGVASSGIPEIEGGWGVAPLADGSGRRKTDAERRDYGNAVYDRLLTEGVEIPPRGISDIAGARRSVRQGLAGTSVRAEELLDASMRDFFNPDEIQEVLGAVENLAQRAPALFRRVIRSQEEFWNDTEAQARVLSQYTSGDPAALLGPRGGVISPLVQAGQRDLEGRLSTAENTLAGRLLAGDRVSDAQRAEIGGNLAGATFGVTGIPFATALNPEVARSGETPSQAGIVNNSLAGITSHELTHFAAGGNGLGGVPEVLAGVRKVMSDFGLFETPSGAIGGNAHLLPSPLAFQDIGELTSESVSAELTGVGSSPFTAAVFGAVNEGLLQSEDREKAAVDQLTVAAQQAAAALEYLANATAAQVRALGVPQSVAQTVIASRPTSVEELAALPGVGPARQAALLENAAKAQTALDGGGAPPPPVVPPTAFGIPEGDRPTPRNMSAENIARRRQNVQASLDNPILTDPPRLNTYSTPLGPITTSELAGRNIRKRYTARARDLYNESPGSKTYSSGESYELLDERRRAALDRNLERTRLRRDQEAALGPLNKGERAYRRSVSNAQRAIELNDISGLTGAPQDALYRGFRPVQPGNGIQSEIWQEASSSRSGSTKRAEALRAQLRGERFSADPVRFGAASQAAALIESEIEAGSFADDPQQSRRAQRRAAQLRSEYGLTNQDVKVGGYELYDKGVAAQAVAAQQAIVDAEAAAAQAATNAKANPGDKAAQTRAAEAQRRVAEARAGGNKPPPPPPPGYNEWAASGAPRPGSYDAGVGGGGRGSGGSGGFGYSGDRGGSWFSRMRQSVRGSSGLGGFFGQGALSVVRYGLPSMALYGAASGISNSLREAEEFQYNIARMESQLEALGDSGTTNIDAVKDSILDLARNTGVAADQITEMQLRIRGAFAGETVQGLSGEALISSQTDAAAKLAVVTKLDPTAVNNDLTAASLGFDVTFENLGNIVTKLESESGVPAAELVNFLGDVAPVASDAGFSAEQISSIGALVLQRSGRSGTALAEAFNRILPAVNQNKPQLLELAGQEETLRTPEFIDAIRGGDVATVVTTLAENFEGLNKQSKDFVINLLGGRREAQALIPALSNSARLTEFMKEASDSAGSLDERFAKLRETLTNTLARLSEQIRTITILLLEAGLSEVFEVALTTVGLLVGGVTALLTPIAAFNEALGGIPGNLLAILALFKLMQVATGRFATSGSVVSGLFGGVGPRGGKGFSVGDARPPFVVGSDGVVTGGRTRYDRFTAAAANVGSGVRSFAARQWAPTATAWNRFQIPSSPYPFGLDTQNLDPARALPSGVPQPIAIQSGASRLNARFAAVRSSLAARASGFLGEYRGLRAPNEFTTQRLAFPRNEVTYTTPGAGRVSSALGAFGATSPTVQEYRRLRAPNEFTTQRLGFPRNDVTYTTPGLSRSAAAFRVANNLNPLSGITSIPGAVRDIAATRGVSYGTALRGVVRSSLPSRPSLPQGGSVLSAGAPIVSGLSTVARGAGGVVAGAFGSAATFLAANPFVGIMALAAVYSLVSSQIDKAKQELDDLASEIREGNEKAYNLESSGKDATAVVRRYGALGEQAMAAFEDQGPWDRGWRTIFGVESEGELISGEREAMLLRPEERELLNAVAGTDLEDRGVRLPFGKTDRRASGQQTIAEFRRGQEDLASYGKDFKVSASGWKGALNDIGSFVPGLEDVGVYYGPDAVSVESLASSKESGALSTEGFELGKSIIEASGSTELNSDVFKAATGANRIDALTKIVDDADQKYSSDAQNQAKNILQKLREGGITDEEFAGAAFELEEAADPEAALTKNLQTLASLQESGYLSIEEYAKRGREALAGRAKALFGGNKQAATEEEIAAYLKDQAAFNASIGAARQKEVQQTLENYQAFGVDDTELSLRTIDLNLQTIRDPAIQDPDTIRNAALAVIQASNAVYGELASRAGSAEAAAAILDKAKDDPVVKEAVDALNKAKIMGSSTYKNGALGYQNLRRDSGTDLLDREIGPDAAFGMAYEDYMDDGAISEDTATFFQDQAAQINEEYKAAAESGKPIDGQQLDNMRGSMQFLMSIMKLFGIVAGEYDPTLVEGLDGTLPGFELTPAQLDKAREKEAFTRSQQRTTLKGQRNAAFASLGGDDTAAAKAVYDAAAANLAAFTDESKYNEDGTETDEFIQAQITFAQTKKAWLDAQTSGAQAFVNLAVSEANLRRDSVGAAIAQLQGANDRLAKATPGSPEAAQAQADQNAAIVALQNAQTQRALSRYDLLAAKAPQGTFTQATIARARAQEQVGRSVGDDLINAEIELTNAERAVRQAQEQRVQSLFRLAQAQNSGDSLASANFGVEAALKAVEFARNEFGADSSEYFDALAGLEQAEKSQRDAYANRVQALFALKKARQGDDPVAGAQLDLSAAQQLYADAVRAGDLDAQIQAEQQLIEAQKAYREAINQARYSQFNLRQAELQAMDDDVGAAQVAAELARQQLADAIARGAGAAEVNNLRAGVINAESNARDVLFRDKLDEYQYLLDTDKITKAQYINYLTALQNTLSPASDEFKELEVTLKRLKEGISGDLQANLPTSLALPTLYEVRRLNQSDPGTLGSSGIGYQDNRVVSITINDVTPDVKDQVVDVLYEALGTGRNGYGTRRY